MTENELENMKSWSTGGSSQNGKILTLAFTPTRLKKLLNSYASAAVKEALGKVKSKSILFAFTEDKNGMLGRNLVDVGIIDEVSKQYQKEKQ